jgi:hypothetical protein
LGGEVQTLNLEPSIINVIVLKDVLIYLE